MGAWLLLSKLLPDKSARHPRPGLLGLHVGARIPQVSEDRLSSAHYSGAGDSTENLPIPVPAWNIHSSRRTHDFQKICININGKEKN